MKKFKRVFVLSPHTDDGELGAGGFISKLIEENSDVYYFAFSTAEESVPAGFPKNILKTEVREATKRLGISRDNLFVFDFQVRKLNYVRQEILEILIEFRNKYHPDLILMPSLNDVHQDHETVASEGLRAFKNSTILGYELIWNNLTFSTTSCVELSKGNLEKKIFALKAYESQKIRPYMSEDFILSLAKARGIQFGLELAESFEVIRWIIK